MNKLNLSDTEIIQLKKIHKYTRNNSMKENRIRTVLLYNKDKSFKDIREILLIERTTVKRYIDEFTKYRMKSIDFEDGRKTKSGNKEKLSEDEKAEIIQYLEDNIVSYAQEIQQIIKDKFDITYSLSGATHLLHSLEYSYKKVIAIPQKGNNDKKIEEQRKFEKEYKELKEKKNDEDKIYFLDGVHPTHNMKIGYAWSKKGEDKIVETNTGRDRVNLNGAYDVENGEVITLQSDRVNAQSTIKLIDKILENNSDSNGKIYLFSDNAKYYRAVLLRETLEKEKYSRIVLDFLPSYSPNLNPIERVWKFFKNLILKHKFYKTFKEFKEVIDDFFGEKITFLKERLKIYASDNFHILSRNTT
jgi:transposase